MSRIDEALRRAEADGVLEGEGVHAAPFPRRAPARTPIEEYPRESNVGSVTPEGHSPIEAPAAREVPDVPVITAPVNPVAGNRVSGDRPARSSGVRKGKLVARDGAPVVVEQYRRLAAALHDVQIERGLKTVMITSAVPGEGKTLTVANLGLTLSESYGRRVLLIDADLRWPTLHQLFGIADTVGLSEVLSADYQGDLPIVPLSPSLSLLPAGYPGANPLAGLTSDRMAALLDDCASRFDWVLIDTPPVGLLPDAQLLARLTRAVVFVIGAGSTPSALVARAVSELGPDCVLGTVLNRVEERTVPEIDYYGGYAEGRYASTVLDQSQ